MKETSSLQNSENSYFGDEVEKTDFEQNKNQIDFSKNSSNPEGIFDTVNKKIKYLIENGKDLSYSNSNSKISVEIQNKEQFLYARYWCANKKSNNDTDSSSPMTENKKNKKINLKENFNKNKKEEEKIIYFNSDEKYEKGENKFNDDFDEEDMEEKTIEKNENDINEINSIKMNKNNLNNKDTLSNKPNLINFNNNKEIKLINPNINSNSTPNKLNPTAQNPPNQSFMPYIYNPNQVQSFISSYTNYPSNLSKGSFISTNNSSSNNKYKKSDDMFNSEIEEDDIRANNITNNLFAHGNKFGPHLIDYSHIQNNNINLEQNNINNINNFNINNNFMYNRIPKMNLNMVYYIPFQQQTMQNTNNFNNNGKIINNISNINNNIIINENNNNTNPNSNTNINLKNQNKEGNNNIINNNSNKTGNSINNGNSSINNNNGNKIKEKEKEKEKEKSDSKDKKNKNKSSNTNNNKNSNQNNNTSNNNFRNSNNNYKNITNNNYKNTDNHNTNNNANSNNNNNSSNSKGEKNLLNLDDIISGKDTRTTVMIRNIPIKYTDNILIEELDEFKGKYDCLYMPYDYEKKGNKGYAFINFVNPLHILYFHEKFCGKKWPLFESNKICELNSANFQGINEIQKHSKNYKGIKKPLFYSEPNKNNSNKENIIIPLKYLNKIKMRYPKIKYKENKTKKIFVVESFE